MRAFLKEASRHDWRFPPGSPLCFLRNSRPSSIFLHEQLKDTEKCMHWSYGRTDTCKNFAWKQFISSTFNTGRSHPTMKVSSEPFGYLGSEIFWQRKMCMVPGERKVSSTSFTGWRSISSIKDSKSSNLSLSNLIKPTEAEIKSPAESDEDIDFRSIDLMRSAEADIKSSAESDEDFDFRNFPALTSSFFEDYKRPSGMELRKKRLTWQERRSKSLNGGKRSTSDSSLDSEEHAFDFDLLDTTMESPLLQRHTKLEDNADRSFQQSEVDGHNGSSHSVAQHSHQDTLLSETLGKLLGVREAPGGSQKIADRLLNRPGNSSDEKEKSL
ncbi:hypothetical protein KP509_05G002500 [Ceratopteris richardii]|uniref:Uncharacterized protein n=1 Tax=Ceratopteris richardii TaxID=49495 RepID=A0A8T2UVI4_CERRI|nr:hypothetical protein KP509_05G002500 [Ceratopteris richardii]